MMSCNYLYYHLARFPTGGAGNEDSLKTVGVKGSFKSREEADKLMAGREYAIEDGNSLLSLPSIL